MADPAWLKSMVFPGESGGDYNALFGYANRPGGAFEGVDLTKMTVNDVIKFTDPSGPYAQWVKDQLGYVATPTGGYQVVGSTLRDTVKGMGLTGTELYDQATQDAIGQYIYDTQGAGAWEGWGKGGASGGGPAVVASTKGGAPVEGLLGVPPEQDASGLIGLLTGKQKPWAGKLNDIGAVLLALSGSPAAQPLMDQISKRKDAAREDERINRTAAWLASVGRDDLASAMMSGALSGEDAARIAMTPADPMAGIELEKAQLELDNLKAGVDQDPNVQSSAMLPDQSGVVMTLRDGSVQVRTVGGDILSGQAALDYVRKAQEAAADLQRSVYGARREGTLGADIALGGEAAAEAAKGKEVGAAAGAALAAAPVDVATADTTLTYIEDVRNHPGLDLGTGATSLGNVIPGTPGYDFQNRVDQLLSGGFLTAIDQLRGMGALSNAEGQTATRAISRMDTATSKEEFLAALADYEAMVKMGRDRAAKRVQPATETSPLASGDLGLSEDDLKYLEAP